MTQFVYTELYSGFTADIVSGALGVSSSGKFGDKDIGKPVKLGTANNYVLCSSGDEIEGFVKAVEPYTVNDGFSFGSVQRNRRMIATVDAAQVGTLTVGEYAVAGASSALGTLDAHPKVLQGTPTTFKWRVIRVITGTGVAGDTVLLEKV